MGDLAVFLAARLDEDEAISRSGWDVHRENCAALDPPPGPFPCDCGWPARVLRQVEAGRAILAEWKDLHPIADSLMQEQQHGVYVGDGEYTLGAYAALTKTIRHLAAVYRDHPDYDPAWAPG